MHFKLAAPFSLKTLMLCCFFFGGKISFHSLKLELNNRKHYNIKNKKIICNIMQTYELNNKEAKCNIVTSCGAVNIYIFEVLYEKRTLFVIQKSLKNILHWNFSLMIFFVPFIWIYFWNFKISSMLYFWIKKQPIPNGNII